MIKQIRDGFEFVAIHYPFYKKDAINIVTGNRSVEDYCTYIRDNKIEKAVVVMPDLGFLKKCPSLKHLKIYPSYNAPPNFDFSPLYDVKELISLHCQNQYGDKCQYNGVINYENFDSLIDLSVDATKGALGFNKIKTLKSLSVGGYKGEKRDISDMFCSQALDTLQLSQCKTTSLNGIGISQKMQCVYLYHNHYLQDISALKTVKKTLKALRIENCPKIKDFSVLGELENLELLELTGNNELQSLDFIKSMKKLKTYIFDVNVLDGDLSPCLKLSYAHSVRNRKHYNLKDDNLPKGKYFRGNEDIEEWRRLE